MRAAWSALIVSFLLAGCMGAAPVSLITNGGFESLSCGGLFCTLSAGSSSLPGWEIQSGSVDVVTNAYWTAHTGSQSVDLNGNAPAVIRQTVTNLQVGEFYTLDFFLSGNPDMTPLPQNYRVTVDVIDPNNNANNVSFTRDFSMAGVTRPNLTWNFYREFFLATHSTMTLQFTGELRYGSTLPYGPVLDDVALYQGQVPEPGTVSLFAAGGAVLYFLRRRAA